MHLARREPRVASDVFAEWLLDSYTLSSDKRMIDFSGRDVVVPPSRPGWFDLDDIGDNGLPTQISGSPAAGKWKFWTHEDDRFVSSAVRSFVTSAGACSLDLGIPQFASHPNFDDQRMQPQGTLYYEASNGSNLGQIRRHDPS